VVVPKGEKEGKRKKKRHPAGGWVTDARFRCAGKVGRRFPEKGEREREKKERGGGLRPALRGLRRDGCYVRQPRGKEEILGKGKKKEKGGWDCT